MSYLLNKNVQWFLSLTILLIFSNVQGFPSNSDSSVLHRDTILNSIKDSIKIRPFYKKTQIQIINKSKPGSNDTVKGIESNIVLNKSDLFNFSLFFLENASKSLKNNKIYANDSISITNRVQNSTLSENLIKSVKSISFYNSFLVLIFIVIILIITIRIRFLKYISQIFIAIVNKHETYRLFREHNPTIDNIYRILNFVFIFSTVFQLFFIFQYFQIKLFEHSVILNLAFCTGIVCSYILYNSIVHRIFGFIFKRIADYKEYFHCKSLFNKIIGLCNLPIIILTGLISGYYTYNLIILSCFIFIFFSIIAILKGSLIMVSKNINIRYWLLYLLCVEILPLIISYKILRTIL